MSYIDIVMGANEDFFEHLGDAGTHVAPGGAVRAVQVVIHDDLGTVEPVGPAAGSQILIDVQKPTSADVSIGEIRARGRTYYIQRIEMEDETQITVTANR